MSKINPIIKVMLTGDVRFFGSGTAELFTLIDETSSVRLACGRMGLSYSKAWKMLNAMEKELAYRLVERRQGGKSGGSAHLTEPAKKLLEKYHAFENACKESAEKLFSEHFD